MPAIIPISRTPVSVRPATSGDLLFIDALQKQHSEQLGYFPTKQFEGYIAMGAVLLAESNGQRVGYVISRDRYLKRDELGVIFQLCVTQGEQRKLVGAELVREVFTRSAYGCRLYCCWCAQDLAANHFWQSLGFLPIAFRAGSTGKRRVHIFWERRIREGDATTPYWFPAQTNAGAIREDRLVFPIPPGTHWSEVKAVQIARAPQPRLEEKKNPGKMPVLQAPTKRRVQFGVPSASPAPVPEVKKEKPVKKPKAKNDPKLVAAARELRDRYLEHINTNESALLPRGKYDVARALASSSEALALPAPRAA